MIISTYQPFFAPFLGFFSKASRCHTMVLLDDVRFPQGSSWLNRNRFKNDKGKLRITIPVWKKSRDFQKINQVKICGDGNWRKKHLISLKTSYTHAPYFCEHLHFVESIFSDKYNNLFDLNLAVIKYLMKQLDIATELILLSDLAVSAQGTELLVKICQKLGATSYLIQTSAKKFLNLSSFAAAKIQLIFFDPPSPIYPQLWGNFIPNLSAFDLIFNCGPKSREILTPHK